MDSLLQGSRDFLPGWAAGAELIAQFHFTWRVSGEGSDMKTPPNGSSLGTKNTANEA